MNIEENFNRLIESLITTIKDIKDFGSAQLPDICNQLLEEEKISINYGLYSGLLCFILSLVFGVLTGYLTTLDSKGYGFLSIITGLIASGLLIGSICTLFSYLEDLSLLKGTPKLILLRKLKRMIK